VFEWDRHLVDRRGAVQPFDDVFVDIEVGGGFIELMADGGKRSFRRNLRRVRYTAGYRGWFLCHRP
jgi:hypothetical protein